MSKSQSDKFEIWSIFRKADFSGKISLTLSTWFGTGLLPVAPGTFGTLGAVPLVFGLACLRSVPGVFIIAMVVAVAIWTSERSQELLGNGDPSEVVIDEVAGFLLTMFLLPPSCMTLGLGFVLFRVFDILKPYPIKQAEKLWGGLGIVMDDLVAGIYAHLSVRLILFFVK
jgi:phosphatidylglycerophosphatase A